MQTSWVLLLFQVISKGTVFNWAKILSTNISQGIIASIGGEGRLERDFFMSSYLIDSKCTRQQFLGMNWEWN